MIRNLGACCQECAAAGLGDAGDDSSDFYTPAGSTIDYTGTAVSSGSKDIMTGPMPTAAELNPGPLAALTSGLSSLGSNTTPLLLGGALVLASLVLLNVSSSDAPVTYSRKRRR